MPGNRECRKHPDSEYIFQKNYGSAAGSKKDHFTRARNARGGGGGLTGRDEWRNSIDSSQMRTPRTTSTSMKSTGREPGSGKGKDCGGMKALRGKDHKASNKRRAAARKKKICKDGVEAYGGRGRGDST